MEEQTHLTFLKRAGWVLLAIGLADIGFTVYSFVNHLSHSVNINLLAVIAGIFLLRGSLRAASLIRWLAVFGLGSLAATLLLWPLFQPIGLTLAQARVAPGAFATGAGFVLVLALLLLWLVRTLGAAPIAAERARTGHKRRNLRIPAALGVGAAVAMALSLATLLGGDSANQALSLARRQLGPGYELHVSALNVNHARQRVFVSSVVAAWNEREVRYLPVSWEAP